MAAAQPAAAQGPSVAPAAPEPALPGKPPIDEGFVTTEGGVRLYYRIAGVPEGRTLVVPFASLFADGDFERLEEEFRVVYYDMRGRGRSDSVSVFDLSFAADIRDLEAVRSGLDLGRISLLGVSMLGSVCLHYALAYAEHVDRVITVSPLPARAMPWMAEMTTPRTSGRVPEDVLDRVDAMVADGLPASDPIAFAEAYNEVLIPHTCAVAFEDAPAWAHFPTRIPNEWAGNASIACGTLIDTLGVWDWRDEFAGITVPVLIVTGTEDYFAGSGAAVELAASTPRGRLVVLDGAGHFAHVAEPSAFFQHVTWFLREDSTGAPE